MNVCCTHVMEEYALLLYYGTLHHRTPRRPTRAPARSACPRGAASSTPAPAPHLEHILFGYIEGSSWITELVQPHQDFLLSGPSSVATHDALVPHEATTMYMMTHSIYTSSFLPSTTHT
jgi:hypothetical protein